MVSLAKEPLERRRVENVNTDNANNAIIEDVMPMRVVDANINMKIGKRPEPAKLAKSGDPAAKPKNDTIDQLSKALCEARYDADTMAFAFMVAIIIGCFLASALAYVLGHYVFSWGGTFFEILHGLFGAAGLVLFTLCCINKVMS